MILARAGAREVSDGANSDAVVDDSDSDSGSDSSIEVLHSAPKVHTAVARRAPTPPPRRNTRINAPELVNKLSKAFDPEAQQSRDHARSDRSFQTAQLFTVNAQLRDAQATTESLRTQLAALQNQVHAAERARDLAEFKLQLVDVPKPKVPGRQEWLAEHHPDLERVGGQVRSERVYSDGGRCTTWHSDPSDDEKENWAPHGYPSSSSPFPSSSSSLGPPLSSSPAAAALLPALPIAPSAISVAGPSSVARTTESGDALGPSAA